MKSEPTDYRFLSPEPQDHTRERPHVQLVRGGNGTMMAGSLCPHCLRHAMTSRHIQANVPCPVCGQRPRPLPA